jgi:hypothetical protein
VFHDLRKRFEVDDIDYMVSYALYSRTSPFRPPKAGHLANAIAHIRHGLYSLYFYVNWILGLTPSLKQTEDELELHVG